MFPLPRWLMLLGFWVPFVFVTYAAFAPEGVDMPFRVSDVVLHAGAFTYLTAALWRVHYALDRGSKPAAWMAAYGVAIEAIQSLEPTRTAEWKDLFVDVVGILAGLLVYRLIGRFLQPRVPRALEGDVSRPRS